MQTPPPSWEVVEEQPQLAELQAPTYLEPWMGELLAAAEIPIPQQNRTCKFYEKYGKAEVISHRNRSGRLELKVSFDGKPATSVWLEQLLECHTEAAALYFRGLRDGFNCKKSWNALSRKFPEVVKLTEW